MCLFLVHQLDSHRLATLLKKPSVNTLLAGTHVHAWLYLLSKTYMYEFALALNECSLVLGICIFLPVVLLISRQVMLRSIK